MNNATHGQGGSYAIGESGEHALVERTEDHPEGNRPRDEPAAAPAKRPAKIKPAPAAESAPATTEGAK